MLIARRTPPRRSASGCAGGCIFGFPSRRPAGRPRHDSVVASFPDDAVSPEGLVRSADAALYQAKRAGRDRVVLATPASSQVAL